MRTFPLLIHPVLLHAEKSLLVREMRSNRGWLQYALSPKIRQLFPCVLLWQWAQLPWQRADLHWEGCCRSLWQSGPISNLLLHRAVWESGTWAALLKCLCLPEDVAFYPEEHDFFSC